MRETGTVKWYNQTREFGFISRDGAQDLYLNPRGLRDPILPESMGGNPGGVYWRTGGSCTPRM